MSIKKYDMFSSYFFFNLGNQQNKKGTFIGALLTIAVIASALTYFVYLTIQYFDNQIDPKYKSQNFITEDLVEVNLTNDLVGFRFEYDVNKNVLDLEAQQNKTYVVFKAFFNYQNSTFASMTPIDIVNCTNPQLEGYLCIDFSKVSNFTLNINTKNNYKTALYVLTYGCLDINGFQKTSPSNCANQDEINNIVNGEKASLRTKLLSAQFNTTSKQKQSSYRNNYMYTSADQAIEVSYKLQKQITKVRKVFQYNQQVFMNLLFNMNKFIQLVLGIRLQYKEEYSHMDNQQKIAIPYFRANNNSMSQKFSTIIANENDCQSQISPKRETEQQNLQTEQEKIEQTITITNQHEKSDFFDKQMVYAEIQLGRRFLKSILKNSFTKIKV
ncbi:transmembrane protein, putative (macronuclear) [Tetrahymena thermophila SB210]|uniref:Transmembrane protein, putative n=1 Tax=Tetrahymena thermophila (strain SB210) TaxID=312017 RepID=W7XLD3_TETTS|nr:transmembrane protein, putative [Tetrahymena thermophila SB210]EWS76089.1 transmembrane protein, putative [Tetrahymena thermophila SB210]|eukprot:XP_012651396.1 transmembrane protein, putative [Tetrahymena thermophila SB210]